MFSRSFMDFDDDPFFSEHHRQMQEMDRMMGGFGAFGSLFGGPFAGRPFGMLEAPGQDRGNNNRAVARRPDHDPFMSGFGSMFHNMNSMMSQMHRNFDNMASNPNGGYSYSSSQVMSYSNDGSGAPKYFEASSSTKTAPGGVKETQKTMRDSEKGLHKMSVGHHIGDRAHVIEKSKNTRTEEEQQKQDFYNMDDSDAGTFDREWKEKTRAFNTRHDRIAGQHELGRRPGGHRQHRGTPALDNREYREREGRARHHTGRENHHTGRETHHAGREERRKDKKDKQVHMAEPGSRL